MSRDAEIYTVDGVGAASWNCHLLLSEFPHPSCMPSESVVCMECKRTSEERNCILGEHLAPPDRHKEAVPAVAKLY